ncbi:hypothetical protein HBI25_166710 [Parastagonospora nodorum]|nr:hypothetical protein HBI79_150720 [Parastagonospora nodorum]KAH5029925.1 hypothetical protein HBI75_126340 [Parastagonospora nodorum]KAH5055933.1 hypothetical protein HBH96_123840 [Parastagonospora nodorum]KAH5472736.1 hypothetical protein HBI28_130170 [Parastagonospora nodorum]KAH5553819.1 hypothetical protein HBI25_166710 [Parastagonospora nodorum]
MSTPTIIDARFMGAFSEAKALYGNGLDRRIAKAREFLDDPTLSHHNRIKVLVLLSALLKDGEDANACHADAEALWILSRRRDPEGQSEAVNYLLAETRICLDELAEILRTEGQEEFDLDDAVDDAQAMMYNLALQHDDHRRPSCQTYLPWYKTPVSIPLANVRICAHTAGSNRTSAPCQFLV